MKFRALLVYAALSVSAQATTQVAVLNFNASKLLSEDEVGTINDRFETELTRTGAFTVLERRQMQTILAEQGFQQSGSCDKENCEVQIGQLLGVERVITGSIGKVGDVYSMNLKMVDVTTGRILASDVIDVQGGLEQVLTQGCRKLAQGFAKTESPATSSAVPEIKGSGSRAWLWWTLGGIAVVGGGVTAWLLMDNSSDSETQSVERVIE